MIKTNCKAIIEKLYKEAGILRNSKKMEQAIYEKVYKSIATIKEKEMALPVSLLIKAEVEKDLPESYRIDYSKLKFKDLYVSVIFADEHPASSYVPSDTNPMIKLRIIVDNKNKNINEKAMLSIRSRIRHELTHFTQHLIKLSNVGPELESTDDFYNFVKDYINNNFKEVLKTKNERFISFCNNLKSIINNKDQVLDLLGKNDPYYKYFYSKASNDPGVGSFKHSTPTASKKQLEIHPVEYYSISNKEAQPFIKDSVQQYIKENKSFNKDTFLNFINGIDYEDEMLAIFWLSNRDHNPKGYKILVKEFYKELNRVYEILAEQIKNKNQ